MEYKLLLILGVFSISEALVFEGKEDFSYAIGLGSLEFYLRKGYLEIKSCYGNSHENYKNIIDNFAKKIKELMAKHPESDENNFINRINRIALYLKEYEGKMSKSLKDLNEKNSPEIATYVDEIRQEFKKDLEKHFNNIKNPKEWNRKNFNQIEKLLKPIRTELMNKTQEVVNDIAKCMKVPKCNTEST